ncbi:manganese catalase family protein [Meiothermus rufus]|uniref:manganese catalase family protein n=1 Tax=Meiothermus rufus TaxID=604332 RepID=UPI000414D5A7|nr:manganese catalase family protein [Meiothermus rufus]
MFLRIDRLQIELPMPKEQDPNAASQVQALLGGRFGEMSTLMNYMYQSFNFRGKKSLKPYYDLIANIATEELGHIELVAATINSLLAKNPGQEKEEAANPVAAPLGFAKDARNAAHWIAGGGNSLVMGAMGEHWNGEYVFTSGNLILDLLHNFFLEVAARTHKLRVYEMTTNPVAREMIGYLLVRGGVHAAAYGKALESLTGVEMTKLLPIPRIENSLFPEAKKFMDLGFHRNLYRFSPSDYQDLGLIWNGPSPEDGSTVVVVDGPPQGGPVFEPGHDSAEFAPEFTVEELYEVAQKLYQKAK